MTDGLFSLGSSTREVQGLITKAQLAMDGGNITSALGHLREARKLDPENVQVLLLGGECAYREGTEVRLTHAVELLRKAEEAANKSGTPAKRYQLRALELLARCYKSLREPLAARSLALKALEISTAEEKGALLHLVGDLNVMLAGQEAGRNATESDAYLKKALSDYRGAYAFTQDDPALLEKIAKVSYQLALYTDAAEVLIVMMESGVFTSDLKEMLNEVVLKWQEDYTKNHPAAFSARTNWVRRLKYQLKISDPLESLPLMKEFLKTNDKMKALEEQFRIDQLTGMYRKELIQLMAPKLLGRFARVAAIQFDLDKFKHINDTFGHHAGDVALTTVTAFARNYFGFRPHDETSPVFCFRAGGEEFLVLLPGKDKLDAFKIADEFRANCEKSAASEIEKRLRDGGQDVELRRVVTISMGVSEFPGDAGNWHGLQETADLAAYAAKESGRNGVVIYDSQLFAGMTRPEDVTAAVKGGRLEGMRRSPAEALPLTGVPTGGR